MEFHVKNGKKQHSFSRKEGKGMWKAAHLRLAKWLLNQEELEDFGRHKIAFLVGSILPDCMPSFVTKRHRLEDTFFVLKEEIQKLQEHSKVDFSFCLHFGMVLHYVADYFTYPHNKTFHGNFLEHCIWERKQQQYLTRHLKKSVTLAPTILGKDFCQYLLKKHEEYLKRGVSLENDCNYVVEVSYCFAVALMQALEIDFTYNVMEEQK